MDHHENAQQHDGSNDAKDGDDLRALVDQFEAAERELRATEELRRVHAEQVARLRQEVTTSVDTSLEACAAERADIESRLHGLEERERYLQGIKERMTGEAIPEMPPVEDPTASPSAAVPPVSESWVVKADPEGGDTEGDAEPAQASEEGGADSGSESGGESDEATDAPAAGDKGSDQNDAEGAYEDGWYEVLKQQRR